MTLAPFVNKKRFEGSKAASEASVASFMAISSVLAILTANELAIKSIMINDELRILTDTLER